MGRAEQRTWASDLSGPRRRETLERLLQVGGSTHFHCAWVALMVEPVRLPNMQRAGLYSLIIFVLGVAALAAGMVGLQWERFSPDWYRAQALPAPGRAEPDEIDRAIFSDGRIWALTDGEVWAVDPTAATAQRMGVVADDICAHRGVITTAAATPSDADRLIVLKRGSDTWEVVAHARAGGAGLVALECSSAIRLLLSDRLITVDGSTTREVKLSQRIPATPRSVALSTGQHLLVGTAAGEWGGAIWRVNARSGLVEQLGKTETGELCGRGLELACAPINDLTASPGRPGCFLAAAGTIVDTEGGLLEVCGERVHVVPRERASNDSSQARHTIFGFVATGSGLIANTVAGLHAVAVGGHLATPSRPKFRQAGPFQFSAQQDFALLRAPVDERFHPAAFNGVVVRLAPSPVDH